MRYSTLIISSLVTSLQITSANSSIEIGLSASSRNSLESGNLTVIATELVARKEDESQVNSSKVLKTQSPGGNDKDHDDTVEKHDRDEDQHDDDNDLDQYDADDDTDALAEDEDGGVPQLFTRARYNNNRNSNQAQGNRNSNQAQGNRRSNRAQGNQNDSGNSGTQSVTSAMLRLHNAKRRLHGSPPMKRSASAEADARRGVNCNNAHSKSAGENIAWGNTTPNIAFGQWYGEGRGYDYNSNNPPHSKLHFTQVVWKRSTGLGCARKKCGNGYAISCVYSPPGNMGGQYTNNVKSPNGGRSGGGTHNGGRNGGARRTRNGGRN